MCFAFPAEWVKLEYRGGQAYGSHCKNDPGRRAEIMFICDPDKLEVGSIWAEIMFVCDPDKLKVVDGWR